MDCVKLTDWGEVAQELRRNLLVNQCLIESLENNMPPVPREVFAARASEDPFAGIMIVEEFPHGTSVSLRASQAQGVHALLKCLQPDVVYQFVVPTAFRQMLETDVQLVGDTAEVVSMTVSAKELQRHETQGEIRQLGMSDKSLTDAFPPPDRGPAEPPLSPFVEWAEMAPDKQVVFGLLDGGEIVSFVQFGWVIDNIWEVGAIRTREAEKQKGYAKAVLSGASSSLLRMDRVPLYQVRSGNTASVRTAEAVGYREIHRLWSCTGRIRGRTAHG